MLMASLALISLGLFWLAGAGTGATYWQLGLPMVLIGIGNGGTMAPLTASGVRSVSPRDQGADPVWSMSPINWADRSVLAR